MDIEDKNKYIARYTARFAQYGHDPRTLGWAADPHKICRCFEALAGIGDLRNKKIIDVGCGFGDFLGFLQSRGVAVEYTGLDIVPTLTAAAGKLWPEARILEADILTDQQLDLRADYIFASGIFNTKVTTLGGNENYIPAMLKRMFEMAEIGVYADFLSTNVDFQHEIAYHTDMGWLLNTARRMSRRFCLRHDYLPYEFCIYMYKDEKIENNHFLKELY